MSRYPRLSDSDLAIVGQAGRVDRSVDVLEVTDGEALSVAEATAAIRLRIDIAGADKPMYLALSPPVAKHISRVLRHSVRDYVNNRTRDNRGRRGRAR